MTHDDIFVTKQHTNKIGTKFLNKQKKSNMQYLFTAFKGSPRLSEPTLSDMFSVLQFYSLPCEPL